MLASDIVRLINLTVIVFDVALIIWLMRHNRLFTPIGWVLLIWLGHGAIYHLITMIDLTFTHLLSIEQINIWSQVLRLHGYTSIGIFLLVLILGGRKK